jgi:hypothetical protein
MRGLRKIRPTSSVLPAEPQAAAARTLRDHGAVLRRQGNSAYRNQSLTIRETRLT